MDEDVTYIVYNNNEGTVEYFKDKFAALDKCYNYRIQDISFIAYGEVNKE